MMDDHPQPSGWMAINRISYNAFGTEVLLEWNKYNR